MKISGRNHIFDVTGQNIIKFDFQHMSTGFLKRIASVFAGEECLMIGEGDRNVFIQCDPDICDGLNKGNSFIIDDGLWRKTACEDVSTEFLKQGIGGVPEHSGYVPGRQSLELCVSQLTVDLMASSVKLFFSLQADMAGIVAVKTDAVLEAIAFANLIIPCTGVIQIIKV